MRCARTRARSGRKRAEVDVQEQLEHALTALAPKLQGVTVVRDFAPGGSRLRAYASELQQVWVNLLENAADALARQGPDHPPHLARGRSIARGNRR